MPRRLAGELSPVPSPEGGVLDNLPPRVLQRLVQVAIMLFFGVFLLAFVLSGLLIGGMIRTAE
ncbi:hypothetical protein [Pseudomonas subflava]|uniref:hypothetical protein n=1 Tax=Pseudomonas subflava TaxID=2952933 RepID=UPI0020799257|nr:hypothetical protein [Pseudomonas subflava]